MSRPSRAPVYHARQTEGPESWRLRTYCGRPIRHGTNLEEHQVYGQRGRLCEWCDRTRRSRPKAAP